MALADEVRSLRDRALNELTAAHDFYADTRDAWQTFQYFVVEGYKTTKINVVTGTESDQDELASKAQGYIDGPLIEASFQQFLSIFEGFVFDLMRLWLTAHPRSLGARPVDLRAILDAPDREAIIAGVVRKELNEVMYEKPAGWFAYLEGKVKLGCPSPDEVERFSEVKARRDVLAHNQGIANAIYRAKAGRLARFEEGERVEIPESEHRSIWDLLRKMVADVGDAAIAKAA